MSPDAKFLFRRGCVHAGLGDAEEALVDLAAAHKLLPTDVAISRKLKEVRRYQ